jgi:hypothetical protein
VSTLSSRLIVERVENYLATHADMAETMDAGRALHRTVWVRSRTWLPWLRDGGYSAKTRSYTGPLPERAARAATSALEALPPADTNTRRCDKQVTREVLVDLSAAATDDASLVQAWVATMMWGSSLTNGRGPWRTAQGLAFPGLTDVLATTLTAVRDGDLETAHARFRVPGSGEAFFTKWLWVSGLGTAAQAPLILDLRVLTTLRHLHGEDWSRPRGASGYRSYVTAMHDAAAALAPTYPNLTAEKLEWLLFDRSKNSFAAWLTAA